MSVQREPVVIDFTSSRSGFWMGLQFEVVNMWERCTVKRDRT